MIAPNILSTLVIVGFRDGELRFWISSPISTVKRYDEFIELDPEDPLPRIVSEKVMKEIRLNLIQQPDTYAFVTLVQDEVLHITYLTMPYSAFAKFMDLPDIGETDFLLFYRRNDEIYFTPGVVQILYDGRTVYKLTQAIQKPIKDFDSVDTFFHKKFDESDLDTGSVIFYNVLNGEQRTFTSYEDGEDFGAILEDPTKFGKASEILHFILNDEENAS